MKIGVMVAMDKELALFGESPSYKFENEVNVHGFIFREMSVVGTDTELVIARSGIGKANAAACAALLIDRFNPEKIVSTGVCGCLAREGVAQRDIICAVSVRYHDVWCAEAPGQMQGSPQEFLSPIITDDLIEKMREKAPGKVLKGRMLSGDWFVDTVGKARAIRDDIPTVDMPDGIDMESGAIAQVCDRFGIPFGSIRIVSDTPLRADAPSYFDFWDTAAENLFDTVEAVWK